MSDGPRRLLLLALLAAGGWACAEAPAPEAAPVAVRAGTVVEPPRIRLGDTATVEVAVVTPPGYRVDPIEAPEAPARFWLLGAEAPEVEREPSRWIHRTRFRVRARATGESAWPAVRARVVDPDGGEQWLEVEARPLEVVEVSRDLPDRLEPFSFRRAERAAGPTGFAAPALLGAAGALAGVALFALVRRVRRARQRAGEAEEPAPGPWRATQAVLETALAQVESDPIGAADAASIALRRYIGQRYRTPASSATTEELSASAPPFAMSTRWPTFVQILRGLDGMRFRADRRPGDPEDLRSAIRDASRLVADCAPQGNWR